jgi:hypothetical protein
MPADGVFATPRPAPEGRIPALAGTAVIVVALPVFLIADWPLAAWGIAAVLWVVYQGIGLLLERLSLGMDSLAQAGLVAFGRMFRAVALTAILIAVAISDAGLGLPAAIVYALAFTVEFSLSVMTYLGGETKE